MNDIRQKIINTGKALLAMQLQNSHSGNISYRAGSRIYITRAGSMKGHLEEGDIISFDMEQSCHDVPRASSEAGTHQGILRYDQAVIHTHCIPATILSCLTDSIEPIDWLGNVCLKSIPVREFDQPVGSAEMERTIPEILSRHRAMVVKAHGPFVRGATLEDALAITFLVDCSSKIVLHLKMMGLYDMKSELPKWPADVDVWNIWPDEGMIGDTSTIYLIRKISSDIFKMGLSPFFTGSISIRKKHEMIFCPNVSSPDYFSPAIINAAFERETGDFFLKLHQSVYLKSQEKSVLFCHLPHALIQAASAQIEDRNVIAPIDAEGRSLYPNIPVVHHFDDIDEIVSRAIRNRMVVLTGLGVLSVGESPQETLHHCSSLKNICQMKTWLRHLRQRGQGLQGKK